MVKSRTQESLIDALGRVRQSIVDLGAIERRLTGQVCRLGVGYHEGKLYTASIAMMRDAAGELHITVTSKGARR